MEGTNRKGDKAQGNQESPAGDRGVPQSEPANKKIWLWVIGALALVAVVWANFGPMFSQEEKKEPPKEVTLAPPKINFPAPKPPPPPPKVEEVPAVKVVKAPISSEPQVDKYRHHKSLLTSSLGGQKGGVQSQGEDPDGGLESGADTSRLGAALKPTRLIGTRAKVIKNPEMMLTQGSTLGDCYLKNAISSELPGIVSCILASDTYGADGTTLLIDRGSVMVGQHQSQIQNGQRRLFILWTSIRTKTGVVAELNSPATDGLGRSGVSGELDTRFFERFGVAILFSILDDLSVSISNRSGSTGDNTQFALGNTTEGAKGAAQESIRMQGNLPPLITKEHGERVSVVVARDVDFSSVYKIIKEGERIQ